MVDLEMHVELLIELFKTDRMFKIRKEVSAKRLDICRGCDRFNRKTSKCEECGCFMEYKSLILSSKCPLGKWQSETNTNEEQL